MPDLDQDALEAAMTKLTGLIHSQTEASQRDPAALAAYRALRRRRVEALLARLGNPERALRVVHVGGTSGKSSTATLIGAILTAAGYRTGVYANPFVQHASEKLRLDGVPASGRTLDDLVDRLLPHIRAVEAAGLGRVTYAEAWFALAAWHFAEQQAEFGVIEVGVGGRYDATNVVQPEVAVITTVDFDHTDVLGQTLAEIAGHKAGIIKPGRPAVTGVRRSAALAVVEAEAARVGAPLWRLGQEFSYEVEASSEQGSVLTWRGPGDPISGLEVRLLGEHQCFNAALAVAAARALARRGADVSEAAVRAGLAAARLPGRLEVLRRDPLLLLDGAHSPEKMRSLRRAVERLFRYRRLLLVFGVLRSKDVDAILREVLPLADQVFTAAAPVAGKPACAPEELAARVAALGGRALPSPTPGAALEAALAAAGPQDLVCVAGSLFLVGVVRAWWEQRQSGGA